MSQRFSVRRVFPGSNTPQGFYSYYRYVLEQDRASRIFVLKGGPGVGKSTLIKRIGSAMSERGLAVEYHHCSSDNDSLDGVVVPQAGIALMDGTAPHVVDPVTPGAIDEIVNLGEYWDERGIRSHRLAIQVLNEQIADRFQQAYRYLAAARSVYDDIEAVHRAALDFGALNQMAAALVDELLDGSWAAPRPGRVRRLFGSAITPGGAINYLESIIGPAQRKVVVQGRPGTGKATLLAKLAAQAVERGYAVEHFHCPFDPEKVQHLVIAELDTAVTTSVEPHLWAGPADVIVDTDDALDAGALKKHAARLEQGHEAYQRLFDQAIAALKEANELHDQLETYYIPYMDFGRIDQLAQRLIARIDAYIEERLSPPGGLANT